MSPEALWDRLFEAAGLEITEFKRVSSEWIPAPGWDTRSSWTGIYPDASRTPVRVEAAAWQGSPVYFEIVPPWRVETMVPSVVAGQNLSSSTLAFFIVVFVLSGVLAWRNVRLGRGDRRGAWRVALFIFATTLLEWACKASHVRSALEFSVLTPAITWVLFIALGFWSMYLAFEPYVRRRWPHAIISWTRLLSGRLVDPLVGSHVLIGAAIGGVALVVIAIVFSMAGAYSPRLPSSWMMSGTLGAFAHVLARVHDAVLDGLVLLFFTFLCKVFLRSEWLAVVAAILAAIIVEPPSPVTPTVNSLVLALVVGVAVYLLLRVGLLSVIVAISAITIGVDLPLTADLSEPMTAASILVLGGIATLALFGFRSTLAGRRLFKIDF
jgi:hypothetical protein